ncbi:MAG: hypothetical protein HY846_06735 [Nitrosomonadales bacterium]|nr:hypothetical protein [Nitrosomonadales bacterium]
MSDYDLPIQFLKILTVFGGICAIILFFWWKSYSRLPLAVDRRQMNIKVEVERRKGERRKRPRRVAYSA